jgi:hypothetical protein
MTNKKSASDRWVALTQAVKKEAPQFVAFVGDSDDFRSVYFKLKDDGTILGVLKGYTSDGTPSVCFGVGYDVFGAILGLEATIASGSWRPDKPWQPSNDTGKAKQG